MKSCIHVFHEVCLYLVFVVISGTLDCDPDTGPAGVTQCFLGTPAIYTKYQCGTCLTDAYIRQSSKGEHQCGNTTHCYYQCMIERYGVSQGSVYDDCLCNPNKPLPQPSVILPASCYSPDGTDCGWYRQCLARMYNCTGQTEYAISYGEKFCNLYGKSRSSFSRKGRQWIDAVRKCLQVALVPALHICQVKPTCEDIKRIAFESHVPCYVNPYQGFSVCNLDPIDWARIFWTIKSGFLPSTFMESFKTSVLIAVKCIKMWSQQLGNNLYFVVVQVPEKIRRKRDTLTDDELAHAIILQISSSLGWTQESTTDWYVFAANTSTSQGSITTSSTDQPGRELVIQVAMHTYSTSSWYLYAVTLYSETVVILYVRNSHLTTLGYKFKVQNSHFVCC